MKPVFNLSTYLPYQLAVASERVSHRMSVDYGKSHGLSVAEWRVIVHLHRGGVVSVREIQAYTNLEKSRVSRAVDKLVASGLVEKHTSKADARLVDIALTHAGHNVLAEILPTATAVESRLLSDLPEQEVAAFYRVLDHFHRILDDDPKAKPRGPLDLEA